MKKIFRYVLNLSAALLLVLPMHAQNVVTHSNDEYDEEVVEENDDSEDVDSALVDSLSSEDLHLTWPKTIQVGMDKLLKSKMFETSQVGIMVWDLEADSCIYRFRERQLMRPASTMKLVTAITALDRWVAPTSSRPP